MKQIQQNNIRNLTVDTLRRMLMFHVSNNSIRFIHEEATSDWRELEERLHHNYPISGVGVKATRANVKVVREEDGGFLHADEALFPGDVPAELASYPYSAASAAYLFTILEGYGDDLVNMVNPGYLTDRKAWHHGVYGDADLKLRSARDKARSGYAKPFNKKPNGVPVHAVRHLVYLKDLRNKFMHEGDTAIDFDDFFESVVATVVFLYFFLVPGGDQLSVYPYYDYQDKWN